MRDFEVYNRISGESLGLYRARTAEGAVEAMARDAGYESAKHMRRVIKGEPCELTAEEIPSYE